MTLADALHAPVRIPLFGTSGLRGRVDELTDLAVYCIAAGTLEHLRRSARLATRREAPPIPIGGDLRASTPRMLRAVARAVTDAGLALEHAGAVPTPALALRAQRDGVACIVVTGSHIPADRNGLKAYGSDGELAKDDEAPVARAIDDALERCLAAPAATSPFGGDAMLRDPAALPPVSASAARDYVARYAHAFPSQALAGLRILVFEHSAVGRDLLCEILEAAGAEVLRAGRSEDFVPIDTEALTGEQLALLGRLAAGHPGIDALVSTDGDGDRPLVCGVDGHGTVRFVRGDALGVLVARYLGVGRIAVPVTASPAIAEWAHGAGVTVDPTRVGSPHVIAAMRAALAAGETGVAGFEANGGFLLASEARSEFAGLTALPTRDATLPILAALRLGARAGRRVDELADELPRWHAASGLLDDVDPSVGRAIAALHEPWEAVEEALAPSFGPVRIVAASTVDGLRLELSSGEILHVRPSGNAPQLRAYVFTRDRARSEQILAGAIAEPHGLLRRLQALAGAG